MCLGKANGGGAVCAVPDQFDAGCFHSFRKDAEQPHLPPGKIVLIRVSGCREMGEDSAHLHVGQLDDPERLGNTAIHVLADGQSVTGHTGINFQMGSQGPSRGDRGGGYLSCIRLVNQRKDQVVFHGQGSVGWGNGPQQQHWQPDPCFPQFHCLFKRGNAQNLAANPLQLPGNLYRAMSISVSLDNAQHVACRSGPFGELLKV